MAFIKKDTLKSGTYLRIVESYRDEDGKNKHRTLHQLGKVSDYTPGMLRRMGERLYELGGGNIRDLIGDDIEELGRYNFGFFQIYWKIFRSYGLDKLLERIAKRKRLKFNLGNAILLMLIDRLNDPTSKRENYFNQEEYLGIDAVDLHQLYRALDHLADHQQLVQNCIYKSGRDLFNQNLDVVFYDVTTFYFDSDKIVEGSLRQKGFSKDGKVGKTQILFGLLIDKDKNPIGYKIYSGNTFEGHTFEDALVSLKSTYSIDKVVVVADRGMLNRNNIALTTGKGYEFILGEKLKQLPGSVQNRLLDLRNYDKEWALDPESDDPTVVRYFITEHDGRQIIGTYSAKRAKKDAKERAEKIEKAQKLLKNPSQLKNKARRFFITADQQNPQLDQARIDAAARFDGLLAISTSSEELPVEQVLDHYRNLYKIEHSFRTFKTHLETRPMFHWTDKRIEGHICLCYIGYTLLTHLKNKLEKRGTRFSERKLRKLIERMQVSHIRHGEKEFYLRSKLTDETRRLINHAGKKPLPALIPKDQIINYL